MAPVASRVRLHPDAPEMSSVIWGSMRAEEQFSSPADLAEFLRFLLDHGVTTIDTAAAYGIPHPYTTEAFLGKALAIVGRDKFEIVTKCGIRRVSPERPENRIRHFDFSAEEIASSFRRSLEKLGVDHVELLLLHRPDYLMDPRETAAAMDEIVTLERTRAIGVSNMSPSRVDLLASRLINPIATNQVEFSPLFLEPISNGTFDHALRTGYRPMIWSPVGGGRLLTSEEPLAVKVRALLTEIAKREGLDGPAEAAISFVVRHPVGGVPIVGSGKRERIAGAVKAAAAPMKRDDWYAIVTETSPMLEL